MLNTLLLWNTHVFFLPISFEYCFHKLLSFFYTLLKHFIVLWKSFFTAFMFKDIQLSSNLRNISQIKMQVILKTGHISYGYICMMTKIYIVQLASQYLVFNTHWGRYISSFIYIILLHFTYIQSLLANSNQEAQCTTLFTTFTEKVYSCTSRNIYCLPIQTKRHSA